MGNKKVNMYTLNRNKSFYSPISQLDNNKFLIVLSYSTIKQKREIMRLVGSFGSLKTIEV